MDDGDELARPSDILLEVADDPNGWLQAACVKLAASPPAGQDELRRALVRLELVAKSGGWPPAIRKAVSKARKLADTLTERRN